MFYELIRALFTIVRFFLFRLRVLGAENILANGAIIIASNHVSLLDPPVLGLACRKRQINFMAKSELFKNSLFAAIIKNLGAFPVKRGVTDRTAVKTALERLRQGAALGIFPEGTRSLDGKLGKAEPGVMQLALKTGAAVIPVAIDGTKELVWFNPFQRVTVVFGKPIYMPGNTDDKDTAQRLTEQMMKEIENLLIKIKKD